MFQSNLHTHSTYCDGQASLEDYIIQSNKIGLHSLGFSSHAPLPFNKAWAMKKSNLKGYLEEIAELKNKYASQINIYSGLEADYIEGISSPSQFKNTSQHLDYLIGSVHFVYVKKIRNLVEIDGNHQHFLKACELIGIKKLVKLYYASIRKMITSEPIDILGHLDKIKIQNQNSSLFDESEDWYKKEIDLTLDTLKKAPIVLEINTRGMYSNFTSEPYPSWWIIEKAIAKGINLTLNSDAHHPDELQLGFKEVQEKLDHATYKGLVQFKNGKWTNDNEHNEATF